MNPLGWLNDNLVSAVQSVLKHQSQVPGLQCPSLGITMAFDASVMSFVQVLHNDAGHWLTVSNIGATKWKPEIFVYDSMYQSVGSFAKKQIAAMLASEQAQIDVKMMCNDKKGE